MIEQIVNSEWFKAPALIAGGFIVRMIFDRRKLKAENETEESNAKSAQLDADTKAVELYERYATRMQGEFDRLNTTVDSLRSEVENLKKENKQLSQENEQLRQENGKLHEEVSTFNKQIETLKKQIAKKTKP